MVSSRCWQIFLLKHQRVNDFSPADCTNMQQTAAIWCYRTIHRWETNRHSSIPTKVYLQNTWLARGGIQGIVCQTSCFFYLLQILLFNISQLGTLPSQAQSSCSSGASSGKWISHKKKKTWTVIFKLNIFKQLFIIYDTYVKNNSK